MTRSELEQIAERAARLALLESSLLIHPETALPIQVVIPRDILLAITTRAVALAKLRKSDLICETPEGTEMDSNKWHAMTREELIYLILIHEFERHCE